jgi:hypothetical protein
VEFPLAKALPINITSTAANLFHVSFVLNLVDDRSTYAAVLAKTSTSFADVKITRAVANPAVKKAVAPSLQPTLFTAFKTTMQTTGSIDARIITRYLAYLWIVVSL